VGKLRRTIEETGLTPGSVGLEITESEIMLNAGPAIRTLNDLRSLGLHLYIDDFGTGYSSLSYLQRFPTSTLKIDRTFVMGMESNQENMEIVRAIISLATNLGKTVVAEGVENTEQVELLQSLGCRLFQGNFFLPASDVLTVTRFLEVR
ncbi:EAL domain-containing protein, partial [bacterium]|nr:EAL domain-containing protein [bacterium]